MFGGAQLLAESPKRLDPLTPMTDSNLVRVLQRQTKSKVGFIPFAVVDKGVAAISEALASAQTRGERFVVVDAITDKHLVDMGTAAASMRLITGGSGVALGLPANFIRQGLMKAAEAPRTMKAPGGRALIIAGSCSEATRGQVAAAKAAGVPSYEVDPFAIRQGTLTAAALAQWAQAQPASKPALIYSSADPASVRKVHDELGRDEAGAIIERTLAAATASLVEAGFKRLIIAGGETSGAVVNGLGVTALEIGPEIDPGVPWTRSIGTPELALALKSGNFGAPDFFIKAWSLLS
jgi:uncharacterized protein YgbK (DUF1537 family)